MRMATCHPERKHKARGLCKACYLRAVYYANPERERERRRRRYHERREVKAKNAWHNPGRERARAGYRRKAYGLEPREFEAMLEAQEGRCALCGRLFRQTPHVDHNHKSGRLRGLLCSRCNIGLGWVEASLRRDRRWMGRAVSYLRGRGWDRPSILAVKRVREVQSLR